MQVGVTMSQQTLDPSLLEACVRDVLNITAPRYATQFDFYHYFSSFFYSSIFETLNHIWNGKKGFDKKKAETL